MAPPTRTPSGSSPADMDFVNPHLVPDRRYLPIPAARPSPLTGEQRPLTVTVSGAGRTWTLAEFVRATHGTSLVVLAGGRVVHEWYAEGVGPQDLLLGASMAKSVLAHLVGVAVRDHGLRLQDRVCDHVPELAGSGYDGAHVGHLLTMTTGVDWVEDYRDPGSQAAHLLSVFGGAGGCSREVLAQVRPADPPGTRYAYCTADSQVLDWVRERATGVRYDAAVAQLWSRLGCTCPAVVAADGDGMALAGGGLAATARDWATIGMLQVNGTTWWQDSAARVLDEDWIESSSTPSRPFLRPGRLPSSLSTHVGFGYHWWPMDDEGRRVSADGSRGQFCYVDRDSGAVVLKTSQWPYTDWLADRQWRDLSYLALPDIAAQTRRSNHD